MAKELTDQNFNDEIASGKITLVDFWAPWCGPCRVQGPIVEDIGKQYETNDKVSINKLNVDENIVTAQAFNVMSIPTLIIFKEGKPVEQMVGLQSKASILERLQRHVG